MINDCIFCKILKNEIKSFKLYEDKHCIVILDKFPASDGQSLVISKKHEDYILNLDLDSYNSMFLVSRKIAKAIDLSLKTKRTCFVVEGFQVPHAHIRLHPSYNQNLVLHGSEESDSNLKDIQEKILKNI